ncbi:sigma-70 family RNA polymerase sigma factor [Luteolibacter soli]|uniref:Sigma-70 family RNA polymerase sigma factor n=1 Tax=Luteolibacter soli TaxID=3135280 RepID=A0ABU9AV21_9BACT
MAVSDPAADLDLLSAFVRDRDEAAFRALASRYLGLVFHAALRRTGNRPLSEEITQNVLCALAAKAVSLAKHPDRLPAWLHRATLYESTKAMRSEASRRRREQRAHAQADIHSTPAPDSESQWIDALPHLDLALDRLGDSDRSLLLLHFYESRSFPSIAALLGKSTSAVQKQSQRALEKLARILRGRGVTLSITVIIAGLSSEFAKAAPLTVLHTTTAAAMKGAAGITGKLPWLMTTPSKALIPAALLIAAVPLILQENAISKLTAQIQSTTPPHASTIPATRSTSANTPRSVLSTSTRLVTLLKEQEDVDHAGEPLESAFIAKLAALDRSQWTDLVKQAAESRAVFNNKAHLLKSLLDAMTLTDPKYALTTVFDAFTRQGGDYDGWMLRLELPRSFSKWADTDPAGALAWMQDQQASGKLRHTSDPGAPEDLIAQGEESLLWEMLTHQSPESDQFIRSMEPEHLRNRLEQAAYVHSDLPGENHTADLSWAKKFVQAVRDYLPASEQAAGLADLTSVVEMQCINLDRDFQLSELTPVLRAAGLTPQELETLARSQALAHMTHAGSGKHSPDPATARQQTEAWLHEIIPGKAGQIMREILSETGKTKQQQEAPAK